MKQQLAVLNQNYGPAGIGFKLMDVSRTDNAKWASGGDETGMKKSLRKGGYSALNVYFAPNLEGGLLGVRISCVLHRLHQSQGTNLTSP